MDKNEKKQKLLIGIRDNFQESLKDIKRGLLLLEENINKKEKLDIETRGMILDSTYILEAAIYRAATYNMKRELKDMSLDLKEIITTLKKMTLKSNHEFLFIILYKSIALQSFTIENC